MKVKNKKTGGVLFILAGVAFIIAYRLSDQVAFIGVGVAFMGIGASFIARHRKTP
ncbi:MAG: hypothetical protein H6634_08845 [Anaerolineales bacterium]|nr:hypothetical protein [candidate division KSB1 bacterium]MCB9111345.1 hypothetical protein [Anaerolineales bacterium]